MRWVSDSDGRLEAFLVNTFSGKDSLRVYVTDLTDDLIRDRINYGLRNKFLTREDDIEVSGRNTLITYTLTEKGENNLRF